jgi:hypothetical protein
VTPAGQVVYGAPRLDVLPTVATISCTQVVARPVVGDRDDLEAVDPTARPDLTVSGESLPPLPPVLVSVTLLVDMWIGVATSYAGGGRPVTRV